MYYENKKFNVKNIANSNYVCVCVIYDECKQKKTIVEECYIMFCISKNISLNLLVIVETTAYAKTFANRLNLDEKRSNWYRCHSFINFLLLSLILSNFEAKFCRLSSGLD